MQAASSMSNPRSTSGGHVGRDSTTQGSEPVAWSFLGTGTRENKKPLPSWLPISLVSPLPEWNFQNISDRVACTS